GKGKDPWGGGNSGGNKGGPPDLDEIWRRFRGRFRRGAGGGTEGGGGGPNPRYLLGLIPLVVVLWLLTGMYIVQPGQRGVVMRFGAYQTTTSPGWHWYWPYPVGSIVKVDVEKVRSAHNSGTMLTKDENIVAVQVAVQYRVVDPEDYLFSLRSPDLTVELALKSAVREVVGTSRMDEVIQEGVQPEDLARNAMAGVDMKEEKAEPADAHALGDLPPEVADKVRAQKQDYPTIKERSRALLPRNIRSILQSMLDEYDTGMKVTAVNVQYAQPPEPVQDAFEEAIRAREQQQQKKNLARAYARDAVLRAKGKAASTVLAAKGYKERKIARAQGEAERFTDLLQEYQQAPDVTRARLYMESMQDVLTDSNLILIGQDGGAPLLYLPLQEMLKQSAAQSASKPSTPPPDQAVGQGQSSSTSATSGPRSRGRNR
ncbi:MAG: protease modulator HflK, partial [Salinisphaera sp.]|nr:protease modulator HflK [Salinisphaera sp.]